MKALSAQPNCREGAGDAILADIASGKSRVVGQEDQRLARLEVFKSDGLKCSEYFLTEQ